MQTINDLVKNLGIPAGMAISMVVIAYLWKYNEVRRDKQDELQRQYWQTIMASFEKRQDHMTNEMTAAMKEIVTELRQNRRVR